MDENTLDEKALDENWAHGPIASWLARCGMSKAAGRVTRTVQYLEESFARYAVDPNL